MADRRSVDNILQISVSVNKETYARLRKEDPDMCEALRELMKDDFDKATEEANKRALKAEQERDAVIKERDSVIEERNSVIEERNSVIEERDSVIKERDSLRQTVHVLKEQNRILSLQLGK